MHAAAEIMSNRYTESVTQVWKNGYEPVWAWVNDAKLAEAARSLAGEEMKAPDWKFEGVYPPDARAFVIQSFFLNCINFAFTHFGGKYAKYQLAGSPLYVGAFACSAALTRGFRRQILDHACDETDGMVAVAQMLRVTGSLRSTKKFFRGMNGIPMAHERRENLCAAAAALFERYDGEPWNILEEAGWHAFEHDGRPGIVDLLVRDFAPAYEDREFVTLASGRSHAMHFLKRAQLWPLMLHGRALASNGDLPPIRDAHRIGAVADYSVPNGLRHLGILEYAPKLAEAIDARCEILAGSGPEIGIRAATVVAMVELVRAVNRERTALGRTPITMVEGDYLVWRLGRKAKYSHHLTRTRAY